MKHDRQQILTQGIDLFTNNGYNALGVERICKETGMTKGAFYNAFNSKEDFLLSCLDLYSDSNQQFIREQLFTESPVPAKTRLLNFYRKMLRIQSNLGYSGCMVNNTLSELGDKNVKIKQVGRDHFENFLKVIEPIIVEAQKEGSITSTVPSDQLTELFQTTFNGLLTLCKGEDNYHKGLEIIKLLVDRFQ